MPLPAATKPKRLRRNGRYVLGRRIGAGGMAAVFAARQAGPLGLGRLVALKVMSTALLGDQTLERMFIREAGISARLEHDNIVRVYEVDEADGDYFIAMELVVGATLRELGCDPPPPLPATLAIVGQVADALHYAHTLRAPGGEPLGIVHQDVSPHNVMVTYSGVTKLLDFGVARIGHFDASRTETIRGKPAYLAPEQLVGERIDRRTDIFALGIVLHELLTGHRLFRAENDLSTYDAVLKKPIVRPEGVPFAVADVCLRALQRRPDERFDSAGELASALRDAARAAGVHLATREELARWLNEVCPPRWSLEELELETLAEESRIERIEAVQDLPTRSTVAAGLVRPPVPRRSRLGLGVLAVAVIGAGGAVAVARSGHLAPEPVRERLAAPGKSSGAPEDAPSLPVQEEPTREEPQREAPKQEVAKQEEPRREAPKQEAPRRAPRARVAPPAPPPDRPAPSKPAPADHGIPSSRD